MDRGWHPATATFIVDPHSHDALADVRCSSDTLAGVRQSLTVSAAAQDALLMMDTDERKARFAS